jgi:phthalate 4,5-cis-dihydrodiol dehydrogenase
LPCPKSAILGARFHEQDADDLGLPFLRFTNGASGSVSSIAYQHGAPTHRTEIFGMRGHLQIDPSKGMSLGQNETWELIPENSSDNWMIEALGREWLAFLEAINTKSISPVTGEYARHIIEIIKAAGLSAQTKREVAISSRF